MLVATYCLFSVSLVLTSRLSNGIAKFYDKSSGIWERTWGEHMHHGYYKSNSTEFKSHKAAQIDMIKETLEWARVENTENVLDVGCGIGGSLRYIVDNFNASGIGISLSSVQIDRANVLSFEQGLENVAHFRVADAMNMPFPDNSFDLVWSMESGEHMPDKSKFMSELTRVCAPGGRIIVVAWCHRNLNFKTDKLKPDEVSLLNKISSAYYLPPWCSANDYVSYALKNGLINVHTDDWTENVKRFWPAVIYSALQPRVFIDLIMSGFSTLRGAIVMPLMIYGQRKGLIKFALITAQKPNSSAWYETMTY